jgi:hypothetical protein
VYALAFRLVLSGDAVSAQRCGSLFPGNRYWELINRIKRTFHTSSVASKSYTLAGLHSLPLPRSLCPDPYPVFRYLFAFSLDFRFLAPTQAFISSKFSSSIPSVVLILRSRAEVHSFSPLSVPVLLRPPPSLVSGVTNCNMIFKTILSGALLLGAALAAPVVE